MMAQGRGNAKAILFIVAALVVVQTVVAVNHNVGGTLGWDYAPPTDQTYYDKWAAGQNIVAGDSLVFKYMAGAHNTQVVTASEFNACLRSSGKLYESGNDVVTLPTAGTYYFLCNLITHCEMGMKMKVVVKAAGDAAPPTVAPSPPPKAPTPPPVEAPVPPVVAPTPPPVVAPTPPPVAPTTPPVVAPTPPPVVKTPAPAPVIKTPTPSPTPVPVPSPTPVPVVAPTTPRTPAVPISPASSPAVPPSSGVSSLRECMSLVGGAVAVAFGTLLLKMI